MAAYNARMGALAEAELDAWLLEGGWVVTASERAARALAAAYHRARQADGLTAWVVPNIQDWNAFVRSAWNALVFDERLVLNPTQEQSIWAKIAGNERSLATLLEGPVHRLAGLAIEAHNLICSYAPQFLRAGVRSGWQNDAGVFSCWLAEFDEVCRTGKLIGAARLPVELLPLLAGVSGSNRPQLVLAGFDRLQLIQRAVFDAWGSWRELDARKRADAIGFYEASDEQTELAACALWCRRELTTHPGSRILVIAQDIAKKRGQIERTFGEQNRNSDPLPFEFSLGIVLSKVSLPRAAYLLLRWLSGPLAEYELDWLFSSGFCAADAQETAMLQAQMRALRHRGLERTEWTLKAFLHSFPATLSNTDGGQHPFEVWTARVTQALQKLDPLRNRRQSPLEWAELATHLLEWLSFARANALSSQEYQAFRRLQGAIETAGALGFDGRRIRWDEFLSALGRTLEGTLFAPESRDAAIQIAGPAESAGLSADAIWFLGATEELWPSSGATHPLLPLEVQRGAAMPHASAQLDWDLAQSITARLLTSARQVQFSYSKQMEGVESRPSRIVVQFAEPKALAEDLLATGRSIPLTETVEDWSVVGRAPGRLVGGAATLTNQSQCPFKSFAVARLGAESWQPAQSGLTPAQRGQILHAVLGSVWSDPPHGLRSHAQLVELVRRESVAIEAWVKDHVERVFASHLVAPLRERLPARYLALERRRLVDLISQWLDYESTRVPFDVSHTEACRTIHLAGLTIDLRLDRLDKLIDGSFLVIDYKTGDANPKLWALPRPENVQLPLYAGFGLDPEENLGGLVFAKLRAGDCCIAGSVGAPEETLFAGLKTNSALMKNSLTAEQLLDWRGCIERLAEDFLRGDAAVDPRDYPKTCERCGLQTLCRVEENRFVFDEGINDAVANFAEPADEQ